MPANEEYHTTSFRPFLFGLAIVLFLLALTQYIAWSGMQGAWIISIPGILVSFSVGIFIYSRLKLPEKLEQIIKRKTLELDVREKYYKSLIESSADVIVLFDKQGRAVYATPSIEKLTGYTIAEIADLTLISLIAPATRERDLQDFEALASVPDAVLHKSHKIRHRTGLEIHVDSVYRNMLQDEHVGAVVFTCKDVTEKVLAIHHLGERVKELSTIFRLNEILKDDEQPADLVFAKIAAILPGGWQYPEQCEARIEFDGASYETAGYASFPWRQAAHFGLPDGRKGLVEIVYTEEKPAAFEGCFLKEERDLINTIADTIAIYFNKDAQQKALVESEARFRGAFENAAIGMALVSREGKWLKVNKALCDITGYSKEELASMTFHDITHPDDREENAAFVRTLLQGGQDYNRIEKRYLHKDGALIWINLNVAVIRNERQQPLYFVSQIENITEKRKINEQLKESEHKLRLFVEHSPASLAMFDMDMNYVITSKRWVTDYKLEGMSLTGKCHYEIFPTIPENWKQIHRRCLAGASEKCDEDSFNSGDGSLVWLFWEIHPWYKASGEIGGIIMFTEVITDRVETRLKFQNLVERSLVGVYIAQEGRFVYVNPRMAEDFGYAEAELLSRPYTQFVDADYRAVLQSNMDQSLDGIETIRSEIRLKRKTGETVWVEMFGTKTFYRGSQAIIGTMVNITDRKAMELERQNIIHDLVQRNRDLEQFAHILSHNVRAPLSTILGLSSLTRQRQNDEERATTIDGIEQSARQLDTVIKDLNEILHIKRNLSELTTRIELAGIIAEVESMLLPEIRAAGAVIECDFSAAGSIRSVRPYIHSICYNLISNSIKYSRKGVPPHILIRTEIWQDRLHIQFRDNGTGIDLSKYGRQIFGLYKRFHPDAAGRGIGLFMVKIQVEALKGTIEVDSTVGEGSRFTISFAHSQVASVRPA